MSNEQMAAVLTLIQAIWPEKTKWGGGTVRVYAELLGDLDPGGLVAAVKFLGRTEEWPPTPAVIRRRVLASSLAPSLSTALSAARRYVALAGVQFPAQWQLDELAAVTAALHPAVAAALDGQADGDLDAGRFLRMYTEQREMFDRDQLGEDRRPELGPGG